MKKYIAQKILYETEVGYDLISDKFSQTRKHFWRNLEFIADYCKANDKVLDYGCGNGRLLELLNDKDINYWGMDVSQKLIDLAKDRYAGEKITFSKLNLSQTSLAFEDGFFNTIYSIAVFHHFPSENYRQEIAKEFFNRTADGGHVIVTVWYLWQRRYLKNILETWWKKMKGESALDWNDCCISFTDNKGEKFERFHHAFTKRELAHLFRSVGFKIESCRIINGRNIVLVGKKQIN